MRQTVDLRQEDGKMSKPTITIAPETFDHACLSCGDRNYETHKGFDGGSDALPNPADVEQLFTLQIGNQAITLCPACLQALNNRIFVHRTGS